MTPPDDPRGIDAESVTSWFAERVAELATPLQFEQITGGLSNLTYRVTAADGRRWVLRRPPLGHVLATAHDMAREHRIITALGPTMVPVPPVVDLCVDESVNGAPFYVMDFVDGLVASDASVAEALTIPARATACRSLVDVLATIHGIDVDAIGLGDLGRREDYVGRQLSRWKRQYDASTDSPITEMDQLHDRLLARIPQQVDATIVHGDYRIENCILRSDGTIAAVLDWELCTLGDPLADLGFTLVYWGEATDRLPIAPNATTTLPGFATRAEVVAMYAERTGRDVSSIGYYMALGYWKLGCILQGVLMRYRAGAMGDSDRSDPRLDGGVTALAILGLEALDHGIGGVDG